MSKKILVALTQQGQIGLKFSGFVGENCLGEAKALEDGLRALGIETGLEKRVMQDAVAPPQIPETDHGITPHARGVQKGKRL